MAVGPVTESTEAALVEGIMEELRNNGVTDDTDPHTDPRFLLT